MKKTSKISLLSLVLLLAGVSIQTSEAAPMAETTRIEASAPIFGAKRYKKRRIQRQNTVGKTNRRAKQLQRKNGIGQVFQLETVNVWKGGLKA